jgi:hypothetical protein
MAEEQDLEELLLLVLTALLVVDKEDIPITHMRVVEVEILLVEILIFLVVQGKWHTVQTEKVDLGLVIGIKLVLITTMQITVLKTLTDSGVLVVVTDTIHRMIMLITTATAVLVALSYGSILDMYQTLINRDTGRVIEFKKGGTEVRFDVHEGFMWIEGPYELEPKTTEGDYFYNFQDREIQKVELKPTPYDLSRRMEYPKLSDQLDMLFHDMETGLVPGKDTSTWYAAVKLVKENYPKP